MEIPKELLRQIVSDLGLNVPFVKGQTIKINNCWHFSTDGNAVDAMFYGPDDFVDGMNRVYVSVRSYHVIILAFSLMDTHIHFVLFGGFDECNRFMHDYVRRTSRYIAGKYGENNKLEKVPINYQIVDTDYYLKTVICYTIKNAPVGGIPFNALDYPWSSGPLYFRQAGHWSSPAWLSKDPDFALQDKEEGLRSRRTTLKSRKPLPGKIPMTGQIVFPGCYVAYELVEKIYKTYKSFNYFFCKSREDEVESRGGSISHLSIPMQEMRQHKNEVCKELFGIASVARLNTQQRLQLARTLRSRFNSSKKQIIRLSGLVYEEVKDKL